MNTRRVIGAFFVVLCLVLCGLVLRRQVIAHPLRQEASGQKAERRNEEQTGQSEQEMMRGDGNWQPASEKVKQEAKEIVQGQLQAFRAGNGQKAMSYQSQRMQRMFGDPNQFLQMIEVQYPEFGHCQSAQFGMIFSDRAGTRVRVQVAVLGENGHRMHGEYLLFPEDGRLRIFGVQTERLPD